MAAYALVYTKRAATDIAKLDGLARKRLAAKLLELQKDPLGKSRKLSNPRIGTSRFRVGDYRIVFDINGDNLVILRVGHRREIYR